MPILANRGQENAVARAPDARGVQGARRDLREARDPLPRHAGPRVHHPERQALHAPVSQREAHGARGSARGGRDGEGGADLEGGGDPARRRRRRSTSSSTRRSTRRHRSASSRAGSARAPARRAGTSSSAPTKRSGARARASRSSSCAIETSPEDIHGMKAARGILTARGGMTSHAAVVARGMGKPCVAGTSAIAVNYEAQTMTITVYDDARPRRRRRSRSRRGTSSRSTAATGHVFEGAVPTVSAALSRRVRRAHGLGRRGRARCRSAPTPTRRSTPAPPARSAPRGSASAAPSTCSSRRTASRSCAR